jgi:hypothetical protein
MRLAVFNLIAIGLLFQTGPASAQLDCSSFLKPNTVLLDEHTQERLAVLDQNLSQQSSADSSGFTASYAGFGFGHDQAQQASSIIKKVLELDYQREESKNLFLSTIPDKAYDTAIVCLGLQTSDLTYHLVSGALNHKTFTVKIKWRPDYDLIPGKEYFAELSIPEGSGEFVSTNKDSAKFPITPNKSVDVKIRRDPHVSLTVSGTVDISDIELDVPGRSKWKLQVETLKSPFLRKWKPSGGQKGGPACVELDNAQQDTAIIPGSYRFYWESGANAKVKLDPVKKILSTLKEDERKACAYAGIWSYNDFTPGDVKGYAEVRVWKRVLAED